METLARSHATALATSRRTGQVQAQNEGVARRLDPERRAPGLSGIFLIGSVLLHVGVIVLFSGASQSAQAKPSEAPIEVDLTMIPLERAPDAHSQELPMGNLDQPATATVAPPTSEKPLPPVERTTDEPPAAAVPVPLAPAVMTAENPYAAADAQVFTTGAGSAAVPMRRVVRASAPTNSRTASTFGIENGSKHSSEEARRRLQEWYGKVRAELAAVAARAYPRRALQLGQQGITKVRVSIDSSGQLLAASVSQGSGHSVLDAAALSGVRAVGQVSPPPAEAGSTSLTVPIVFRLH